MGPPETSSPVTGLFRRDTDAISARPVEPRRPPWESRSPMYVVPGVPLIPQQKSMACWYASAQMLIQWKRAQALSTRAGHPDPSEVPYAVKREASNHGLPYSHALKLGRLLGLLPIMPTSVTIDGFQRLLLTHGPL